jgi:hypothetical protein
MYQAPHYIVNFSKQVCFVAARIVTEAIAKAMGVVAIAIIAVAIVMVAIAKATETVAISIEAVPQAKGVVTQVTLNLINGCNQI